MTVRLQARNLCKIFGRAPETARRLLEQGRTKAEIQAETGMVVGVEDASFEVHEGEIFVIMGLSGSGKSTLVRMLNRLIEPTRGEVRIQGRDVTAMGSRELRQLRRHEMTMVFQSFALMPHLRVIDNAAYGLKIAGVERAERHRRAMTVLESVGLGDSADSFPDQLSGGMRQRVGLARALVTEPVVMLMDEAFSALDPLIRTEMQDELLRLQQTHARTIVFISHDLDEAIRIGDRIAIMESGRIVQIGTAEEILRNPANDYVRSFFRGVDVSRVYTAGDIARRDAVTVIDRPGAGVRTALHLMRDYGRSYGVLLDRRQRYRGMLTEQSLVEALERDGDADCEAAVLARVNPLSPDASLQSVMDAVAESAVPLPVVAQGHYRGVISRAQVLRTLCRTRGDDTDTEPARAAS